MSALTLADAKQAPIVRRALDRAVMAGEPAHSAYDATAIFGNTFAASLMGNGTWSVWERRTPKSLWGHAIGRGLHTEHAVTLITERAQGR